MLIGVPAEVKLSVKLSPASVMLVAGMFIVHPPLIEMDCDFPAVAKKHIRREIYMFDVKYLPISITHKGIG